jgi:hypothetical protein
MRRQQMVGQFILLAPGFWTSGFAADRWRMNRCEGIQASGLHQATKFSPAAGKILFGS